MARVRLYAAEGIDAINLLDNVNIMINNGDEIYDRNNMNIIQLEGLTNIVVDGISENEAMKVSYIVLSENNRKVGYVIENGYEFVAPNTCKFYIMEDAVGTALQDIDLISASADRMSVSVSEDNEKFFTEIEPFRPCEIQHIFNFFMQPEFANGCTTNYNIAETLVIPPQLEAFSEGGIEDAPIEGSEYKLTNNILSTAATKVKSFYQKIMQTTPTTNVIKDAEGNILSASTLSIGEVVFRKMTSTIMQITNLINDTIVNITIGARWWMEQDFNSVIQVGNLEDSTIINDLVRTGTQNNITSYWSIPTPYVESIAHSGYNPTEKTNYGGITNIKAKVYKQTYTFKAPTYTPLNNKARYSQWVSLQVFNPVSGDSMSKQPYEICNPTCKPYDLAVLCDYVITADLRPDGAPIFVWKYKNRELQQYGIPESIKGGNWRQIPLTGEGKSGSAYEQLLLNRDKSRTPIRAGIDFLGTAIPTAMQYAGAAGVAGSVVPGIGTGAAMVVGGVAGLVKGGISYIGQRIAQKDQQDLLNAQGQVADTELQLKPSNYHREIGYNNFYAVYSYYSEDDLKNFDRFLTLYGYKVNNKKFTMDDFDSRPYFNFVKLNEITFKSDKWSQYTLNLLKQQLKEGVRIWHHLPTEVAITFGNR